jgi:hypothetical protein
MCYEGKAMSLPVYTAETSKISWIHIIQKSSFILSDLADFRGKCCLKENRLFVLEGMSSEGSSMSIIGLEKYRFFCSTFIICLCVQKT